MMFARMDVFTEVALIAASITAIIVAARSLWGVFVKGVKTAIHDEMQKFHSELSSADEFWSEKIGKLESGFDALSKRVEALSARIP